MVSLVLSGFATYYFARPKPVAAPSSFIQRLGDSRRFAASDTKMTAFALVGGNDDYKRMDEKWRKAQPKLHGQIILSQKSVKGAKARQELRQAFARIELLEIRSDCIPNYRHALRFTKDGRTVDAVICFDCGEMNVYDSTSKPAYVGFMLPDSEIRDQFDAIFARLGMKQFKPYAQKNAR